MATKATKKATKKDKAIIEIALTIDRSGSMVTIKDDMQGGINSFFEEQKKNKDECYVTLTEFDTKYNVIYDGVPLSEVKDYNLIPRGNTALLDAIGRTISLIEQRIEKSKKNIKVLFVIVTDGQENASKEFHAKQIFDLIEQKRKNSWEFIFLGANQDAIKVASTLGIASTNSVTYSADSVGTKSLMRGLSLATSVARSTGDVTSNLYDQSAYNKEVSKQSK